MPLNKLALILICVIAAAAVTVWIASLLLGGVNTPGAGYAILPVILIGYLALRGYQFWRGGDK